MNYRCLVPLILLTLAACSPDATVSDPPLAAAPPSVSEAGQTTLDAFLQDAVDDNRVPRVVAVVANPDEVIYEGAFGKQSVAADTEVRTDSIFNLASMTKPVTSVAVMMLAEEWAFELDDPVSIYLPGLADREVLAEIDPEETGYRTEPAASEITIRQLLTHTSGLAYNFSNPAMQAMMDVSGEAETLSLPLVAHPGTTWNYSGSTAVLGDLVTEASGMPLDAFFEARIFEPLGMVDTAYTVPPDKRDRVVTVHRMVDGEQVEAPVPETVQSPVRGDGGLYGTAPDYIRFLRMLLNDGELEGTRILSQASVGAMLSDQTGGIVVETQVSTNRAVSLDFPIGAGADTWGLGFQLTRANAANPDLRAPGSFSWGGIFNTHFWGDPDREIVAVVLMQQLPFYNEDAMAVYQGFERRLNQALAR